MLLTVCQQHETQVPAVESARLHTDKGRRFREDISEIGARLKVFNVAAHVVL